MRIETIDVTRFESTEIGSVLVWRFRDGMADADSGAVLHELSWIPRTVWVTVSVFYPNQGWMPRGKLECRDSLESARAAVAAYVTGREWANEPVGVARASA